MTLVINFINLLCRPPQILTAKEGVSIFRAIRTRTHDTIRVSGEDSIIVLFAIVGCVVAHEGVVVVGEVRFVHEPVRVFVHCVFIFGVRELLNRK
jgi:hypothetical protein